MKLNTRFTMRAAEGTISEEGIRQIAALIASQKLQAPEWQIVNPGSERQWLPTLPNDWAWVWVVSQGDLTGTMPKRVAKFFKKSYGIKCPVKFLSELGNIARRHSAEGVVYSFEFVARFDWDAGEFGDDHSCFWGSNAGARDMLLDNGGLAVRFYDDDDNGIARAWVVEVEDSLLVLFNGYGFTGDATLKIAQVVAEFLKATYRLIRLSNNGETTGTLYINRGSGYIIGPADKIANFYSHDLGWDDIYASACYECGSVVGEYELYIGADDNSYCEGCYYRLFDRCEHCGETYWQSDIQHVDNRCLCQWCAAEIAPPPSQGK